MQSTNDVENKIRLFNDNRDLEIQSIRGKYLYDNLFLGTISLDSIGDIDAYCLNVYREKLDEIRAKEAEEMLKGLCNNKKHLELARAIQDLNLGNFDIRDWKYLLNTVSYLDFISNNMSIIDSLKDLPKDRYNLINDLNIRFVRTRDKNNPEHAQLSKEYKDALEIFNKTATKVEHIIRMGYYYSAILKEDNYARMVDIYKSSDSETKNTLSELAKRFGCEQ